MDTISILISQGYTPFLWAGASVAGILMLEILGLMVGHTVLGLDLHFDIEPGMFAALSDWLHLGKVPVIILLTLVLAGFTVFGGAFQYGLALVLSGGSPWLASAGGVVASLLFSRKVGAALARYIPSDESYAVSADELIGNTATMLGRADAGRFAQAKLLNHFGEALYVYLEPADGQPELEEGAEVVLTKKISMNRFYAEALPRHTLPAEPRQGLVPE